MMTIDKETIISHPPTQPFAPYYPKINKRDKIVRHDKINNTVDNNAYKCLIQTTLRVLRNGVYYDVLVTEQSDYPLSGNSEMELIRIMNHVMQLFIHKVELVRENYEVGNMEPSPYQTPQKLHTPIL
jgi:hypothetical protein